MLLKCASFLSTKPLCDMTSLVEDLGEEIEMCVQYTDDTQMSMLTTFF